MFRPWRALAALFLLTACATEQQHADAPQAQVPFDASRPPVESGSAALSPSRTSLSASSSGKGLSVPHRADVTDPIHLSAHPDALRVRFAVRAIRESASKALQAVHESGSAISTKFEEELHAKTSFRGLSVNEIVKEDQIVGIAVTADGTVDVPLDAALDFWKRNALHVRAVELTKRIAADAAARSETLAIRFQAPFPLVLNPEAHRPELIKRWVARAREFANAAQSTEAPLAIVGCEVPPAVEQSPISIDQVQLSLHVRCRIDTPTRYRDGNSHDADAEDTARPDAP